MIFVARHAEVAAKGICYGQSEQPTRVDDTAAGELLVQQVLALPVTIERVWSSPWNRARGPAERVASRLGLELVVDPRLSELSFGAWEGRAYADLEREPAFAAWMADWQSAAPPDGERLEQLLARVDAWRAEVLEKGRPVLAVTHAGVIRALRAMDRALSYEDVVTEKVAYLEVHGPVAAPATDRRHAP